MSDYPMLISNKLHSFRNFRAQSYNIIGLHCSRKAMKPYYLSTLCHNLGWLFSVYKFIVAKVRKQDVRKVTFLL